MYEATSCFEETLTSLWCPKHLLLPVLNRSVKTLCQLCVRYGQWLSEHIDAQRAVDETALQRLSLLVGLYLDAHLVQRKVPFLSRVRRTWSIADVSRRQGERLRKRYPKKSLKCLTRLY